MAQPVLHLLTGPTASGKSALALRWAETFGAEIICADSATVYRGMDVGAAKPTAEERRRVPHHLLDVADVSQVFDVAEFARMAERVVAEISGRGRPVLVVGGSGFYLKSFYAPVADEVGVTEEMKAEVGELEKREGLPGLVREIQALNGSAGTGALDLQNPRRVANALLRCRASGLTLVQLLERFHALPEPFAAWEKRTVLLRRDLPDLDRRVGDRVGEMLKSGLVEEVQRLRELGIEGNPSASAAIGYRETLSFLRGEISRETLAGQITQNTTRLVRKQMSWFRRHLPTHRVIEAEAPGEVTEWFG